MAVRIELSGEMDRDCSSVLFNVMTILLLYNLVYVLEAQSATNAAPA